MDYSDVNKADNEWQLLGSGVKHLSSLEWIRDEQWNSISGNVFFYDEKDIEPTKVENNQR